MASISILLFFYDERQEIKQRIDRFQNKLGDGEQKIKEGQKKVAEKRKIIEALDSRIAEETEELNLMRLDIEQIKGPGQFEDANFHIDNSRDERGHTFLMVAAQNNDLGTAKTCLQMNTDPALTNPEGLMAVHYSTMFGFVNVTDLIIEHGGRLPQKQANAWNKLDSIPRMNAETSKDWVDTLKTAETAALPAETLCESPLMCEEDEDKRMAILTDDERRNIDFTCFESRLVHQQIHSDLVRRVVLLDQSVYNYCLAADTTTVSSFVEIIEGLKPASIRRNGVQPTKVHRRAIVGTTTTFEVFAASFSEVASGCTKVALCTPFVSGETNGVSSISVLVWAVVSDDKASLIKVLISNCEFLRHKVKMEDRFLASKASVLMLGKDMHLLDLNSTSVWTTSTMVLHVLNLDDGELDRIQDPNFKAKKRIVHSEELINNAIFQTSEEEAKSNEGILATQRIDMSSHISGGAGTGKTLLLIKKVSCLSKEDPSRHILVVSRLPRLVNIIKTSVEERKESSGAGNVTFMTYDELLHLLARRVVPDLDSDCQSFVHFGQIRFECEDGPAFSREFVDSYLNDNERKHLAINI